MRIVIANLPDEITEDALRDALKSFAPADKIKLQKESAEPSAVIEMEITRMHAETLAKRITGHNLDGRALRAWVPAMGWE